MKKVHMAAIAVFLAVLLSASPVFAEGSKAQTGNSSEPTTIEALMPLEVTQSADKSEVRKIYELAPDVDPGRLPRDEFDRGDYHYQCADILRQVIIGEEYRTMTLAEIIESEKNDMETVLALLPQFKEAEDEDGYAGTLMLDTSTIKSEVSEYGSKSNPYSVTRTYPNLSSTDTQYIPKTLTDGGRTLQLTDIKWNSGGTTAVDYNELPSSYNAVATYSGTTTSKYAKGYLVTATYTGEVVRKGVIKIRYTVIFDGTLIPAPEPEPTPEPTPEPEPENETTDKSEVNPTPGWVYLMIPVALLALAASGASLYFTLKNRKEKKTFAESDGDVYPETDENPGDHSDGEPEVDATDDESDS